MKPIHNYIKALIAILIIASLPAAGQDSVTAKILHVAEKTVVYKVNGMKFISLDCKCATLKRGDMIKIPRSRFDSLLVEAKPIRRRQLGN